jgi:hypothetical protein
MSLPPITLVALLLGSPARGEDALVESVVVPLSALPGDAKVEALGPPVGVVVDRLDARIQAGEDATVQLDWTLTVLKAGWVDLPLIGDGVALRKTRLDGRPLALTRAASGPRRLVQRLDAGVHRVRVEGTMAASDARLDLLVARAARARLETRGDGLSFSVTDGIVAAPGAWDLRATERLQVSWAPERPPPPRPRVVTVETASALRVDEVGVEGRARLRYRIVDGTVETLVVRMTGRVDEVEATGPGVIGHRLDGNRLTITLAEPLDGAVSVDLAWRAPPPASSDAAAPVPVPEGARGSGWLSVVRGDDSLLVPTPGRGMSAVSTDGLPDWAQGMVPGRPLVAYQVDAIERAELTWRRINWSPVDAPPTLVDEARYTVVHAEHGRVWVRAAWQVRNDRNPFLRVRLPDGWEPIGLRVAGLTAQPVRADDGRLLVPLEKSVETLDGLVAFPVELLMVGSEAGWDQRGERRIQTPSVDAPIAYARWEVMLPEDVLTRDVSGRPTVVEQWTPSEGGLLIGRATRVGFEEEDTEDEDTIAVVERGRGRRGRFSQRKMPADAAPSSRTRSSSSVDEKGVSQEYWNRAYSAYKDNRFDDAEALLEQSLTFDPDNASARSLQTNVDVLQGDMVVGEDQQAAANRVRENALSKSGHVVLAQAEVEAEAERRMRAGDTEGAKQAYGQLVKMTEQLAGMEQAEAVNQKSRLSSYLSVMDELEGKDDKDETVSKKKSKEGRKASVFKGEVATSLDTEPLDTGLSFGSAIGGANGSADGLGIGGKKRNGLTNRRADRSADSDGEARDATGDEFALASDLDKQFLERIPAGRSYQAAVQQSAGTAEEAPNDAPARAQVLDHEGVLSNKVTADFDFSSVEISGELVKPQGQLLLDRRVTISDEKSADSPLIIASDGQAPAGSAAVVFEAGFMSDGVVEEAPQGGDFGYVAGGGELGGLRAGRDKSAQDIPDVVMSDRSERDRAERKEVAAGPPPPPRPAPARQRRRGLDEGRRGGVMGAPAAPPAEAQHFVPATSAAPPGTVELNVIPDRFVELLVDDPAPVAAPQAVEAWPDPVMEPAMMPEPEPEPMPQQEMAWDLDDDDEPMMDMEREYRTATLSMSGTTRRSVRWPSWGFRSKDRSPPAPPAQFPMDDAVLLPSLPAGGPPIPAFPMTAAVPLPSLPGAGQPVPAFPVVASVHTAAYPRKATADPSFPLRPPPPPAAEFGLDIPQGIDASTLSLSIPETGTGLLLEQRLLPPDEPLSLTLRYRRRTRR